MVNKQTSCIKFFTWWIYSSAFKLNRSLVYSSM